MSGKPDASSTVSANAIRVSDLAQQVSFRRSHLFGISGFGFGICPDTVQLNAPQPVRRAIGRNDFGGSTKHTPKNTTKWRVVGFTPTRFTQG
jgi:hypothetical protein